VIKLQGGSAESLFASGDVELDANSVSFDLFATGTLMKLNGAVVGGGEMLGVSLDLPLVPGLATSCLSPSGSGTVSTGDTLSIFSGDARVFQVNTGGILILDGPGDFGGVQNEGGTVIFRQGGTYSFDSFTMNSVNPLVLLPPGVEVDVEVCTNLESSVASTVHEFSLNDSCGAVGLYQNISYLVGDEVQAAGGKYRCSVAPWCSNSQGGPYEPGVGFASSSAWVFVNSCSISFTDSGALPANHRLRWSTDDPFVTLAPGLLARGSLRAPSGRVHLIADGSSSLKGLVWAQEITAVGGVTIDATGLTGSVCEGANLDTAPPEICPVENSTPPVAGLIVETCDEGKDCQLNYRCDEPVTSTACAHSKCAAGARLSAPCDPCVTKICALDPACCSGAWTVDCVALVASTCDAQCGETHCNQDICEAGAALDALCDPCVAAVCDKNANCCAGVWGDDCVDLVYELCGNFTEAPLNGSSNCDFAVYSDGTLALLGAAGAGNGVTITAGQVGGAGVGSMMLNEVTMNDDIVFINSASVAIYSSNINGNILHGSSVPPYLYATSVSGGVYNQANSAGLARPIRSFSCPGTLGAPFQGIIAPGDYGNVTIADGDNLTLTAGTYSFQSIQVGTGGAGATLSLTPGDHVVIHLCGNLVFESNSKMSGVTAESALDLDIYAQKIAPCASAPAQSTSGVIRAVGNNEIYGFLNAECDISILSGSKLWGMAFSGSSLNVKTGSEVSAQGLADKCRDLHDPVQSARSTPERLCAFAVYASDDVNGDGASIRGGNIGSGDDVKLSNSALVVGSVYSADDLDNSGSAPTIFGDVYTLDHISGARTVIGLEEEHSSNVPDIVLPPSSFSCPGTSDQDVTAGSLVQLSPGNYGALNVQGGGKLELQAGNYSFTSIVLGSNARLILPVSGNVEISVCGQVIGGERIHMDNIGPGADSLRFVLRSSSTERGANNPAIFLKDSNGSHPIFGVFIAPEGDISLGNNTLLYGLAWAKGVFLAQGARVDASGASGAPCEQIQVDVLPSCPVVLNAQEPPETGQCLHNNLGYTDSSCNGFDLALDIPCGDQISVCNHGILDVNGEVEVAYWRTSLGQMALETPLEPVDGICSAMMTIASGNCASMTCALPPGEYTLMVDPAEKLMECDSRRADNWSLHDGRGCGGVGTKVVEYQYEALCPPDSFPAWGFLTWNTQAPGASTISFEGKTGSSALALAGATYNSLGIATSQGTDTQNCAYLSLPSECPVDLVDQLALEYPHERFLALRITLEPQGNDPILEDWEITYTCQFDQ